MLQYCPESFLPVSYHLLNHVTKEQLRELKWGASIDLKPIYMLESILSIYRSAKCCSNCINCFSLLRFKPWYEVRALLQTWAFFVDPEQLQVLDCYLWHNYCFNKRFIFTLLHLSVKVQQSRSKLPTGHPVQQSTNWQDTHKSSDSLLTSYSKDLRWLEIWLKGRKRWKKVIWVYK